MNPETAGTLGRGKRRRLGPPRAVLGDESEPATLDSSVANGSSIVLLLEQGRKAAVLTGDAYPSLVLAGWRRLVASRGGAPKLDLLKLSHHGSSTNTSPVRISPEPQRG